MCHHSQYFSLLPTGAGLTVSIDPPGDPVSLTNREPTYSGDFDLWVHFCGASTLSNEYEMCHHSQYFSLLPTGAGLTVSIDPPGDPVSPTGRKSTRTNIFGNHFSRSQAVLTTNVLVATSPDFGILGLRTRHSCRDTTFATFATSSYLFLLLSSSFLHLLSRILLLVILSFLFIFFFVFFFFFLFSAVS